MSKRHNPQDRPYTLRRQYYPVEARHEDLLQEYEFIVEARQAAWDLTQEDGRIYEIITARGKSKEMIGPNRPPKGL